MKLKLESAELISKIVRALGGQPEVVIRVDCPLCRVKSALLLYGRTSSYECQACWAKGKLTDLTVYCEDRFERRHQETIQAMTERRAVEKIV